MLWWGGKDRTALDAATFASKAPKWGRSERGWASGSEGVWRLVAVAVARLVWFFD